MTRKQSLALNILSKNVSIPMGRLMIEAGYSTQTSRNPKRLTDSKAFKSYFNQFAIEETLLIALNKSLNARKFNTLTRSFEPDHLTRLKAVHIALKLKGLIN